MPHSPETHWNMSSVLLTSGNFVQGWKEFEWRLQEDEQFKHFNKLPYPIWDGSPLKGKNILIRDEQGIGDRIMFASCLSEVISQAELCIVETHKRLVPLFARSFPQSIIIERIEQATYPMELPIPDMQIAIGSLAKFFLPDLASFSKIKAYLRPDSDKMEVWRNRYDSLGNNLKVGISWRGGSTPYQTRKRSIELEQWRILLTICDIDFINLQYGDCSKDIEDTKEKMKVIIHNWIDADPLKDLDNFAAQIAALDLVISIDNSTVHMAGALGVPVWTLLPFVPDWRWMLEREDSPWYPTMRLFRQPSPGDWESVIIKVREELLNLLKKSKGVFPLICQGKMKMSGPNKN
ncbi:MAG: hypothetical protein AB1552_06040 [Nitrospirota bacterium]